MVSSPHVRPPPRSPPPRSTASVSSPVFSNIMSGESTIADNGNNCRSGPVISLDQNGALQLSPLRHGHRGHNAVNSLSPKSSNGFARTDPSPLMVAASLIQSLDIAHTEMTSFAADAAADAERARQNARTAQEIARRYQNRSYPTFKRNAFEASAAESVANTAAASSSSLIITSRPKHPEVVSLHNLSPSRKSTFDGLKYQNGEEKEYENDGNRGKKSFNDDESAGVSVATPVISKQLGIHGKPSNSAKNRSGFHSPSSYERIAQHHADDVLQLTLELEKTKQALKSEQRLHKDCKSSLASMKASKMKLENTNQKRVEKQEIERKQSTTQISHLEQELEMSRLRLQAAEEDAQLALDLAKDSAEQRDKIEESLLNSRKEIEMLKEQLVGQQQLATVTTPKRFVHFADNDANTVADNSASISSAEIKEKSSVINTPRENGPPRSMIAAGRQLLLRRNMSPQDAIIRLEVSPTKSSQRRQQLCRRLNEHLIEDNNSTLLSSSPSRTPLSPTPGINTTASGDISNSLSITNTITKKKFEEYHTAMKILQISGKRLDLDGYWWREQSNTISSNNSIQIDIITRQYCQNVEFKINRQQKDINQLESLCGYLEKKLILDKEPTGC